MDRMEELQRSLDEPMPNSVAVHQGRRHQGHQGSCDETKPRRLPDDPLASPPSQPDDLMETRSSRSASTASRSTNRLSLTLPILPPTAYPSRPTPVTSTTTPAFPRTPLDTPALMSPVDPNDWITAIAAQERRVLELREELNRAESDLVRLKKQWATHEAYRKRAERRNVEPLRALGPAAELQDDSAVRRSADLDRRKALLGQQTQQATPERSRRRVFTGSHTRTLSLLSPTKPSGGFSLHEDERDGLRADPDSRFAPAAPAPPAKRASWAPRSTQTAAVKQLAQDLKTGLWTFMEDLRQATVGDEPITGQGTYLRGMDGNMRSTFSGSLSSADHGADQDTIRATGANSRPRVTSAFGETPKATSQAAHAQKQEKETATEESVDEDSGAAAPKRTRPLQRSRTEATKATTKRFSWTPLSMDEFDDNDWSNWDSPNNSSARWSGTTVNGDIIPSAPEKRDTSETPLSSKSRIAHAAHSPSPSLSSPTKLEELLPPVLNRLTPSNIKRTAADFMKEWERSLSPPDNMAAAAATTTTTS